MKTLITILSVLVLLGPMVFAADTGPLKPAALPRPTTNPATSNVNVQAHPNESRTVSALPVKIAKNATELKEIVREKESQLNRELEKVEAREQNIRMKQNKVKIAVHTLLAMEDLTGGIGRNVSAIAKEFNNSVKNTTSLEAKIQERSAIVKFFLGSEKKVVEELGALLERNAERIAQLSQLKRQCNCSDEIKTVLQEQIDGMEAEQTRLHEMVNVEKKNTGILGWLFK